MSELHPDDPDMLTRYQAADVLGIRLRALHYWRTSGRLLPGTVVKFRREAGGYPLVRFRRSKLEQLLAEGWHVEVEGGNADAGSSDEPSTSAEQE